jgi:hypothetical protein
MKCDVMRCVTNECVMHVDLIVLVCIYVCVLFNCDVRWGDKEREMGGKTIAHLQALCCPQQIARYSTVAGELY